MLDVISLFDLFLLLESNLKEIDVRMLVADTLCFDEADTDLIMLRLEFDLIRDIILNGVFGMGMVRLCCLGWVSDGLGFIHVGLLLFVFCLKLEIKSLLLESTQDYYQS